MAINPSTQAHVSVILEKEVHEKVKEIAQREKRSVSRQIAYWIEEKLKEEK